MFDELDELPPLDGDESDASTPEADIDLDLPPEPSVLEEIETDDPSDAFEPLDTDIEESWLDVDGAIEPVDEYVEDIGEEKSESWLDEDSSARDEHESEDILEDESMTDDGGEEGPEYDPFDALEESTGDEGSDEGGEEGPEDDDLARELVSEREQPAAFALEASAAPAAVVLAADAVLLGAAVGEGRVLLCGDGIYAQKVASLDPTAGPNCSLKRVAPRSDDLIASLAYAGGRAFVAASLSGRVLRSEDAGGSWEEVGALGGENGESTAVELYAEPHAEGVRLWARAHGGGLFRSDDGGRHWEGPTLTQPVRAFAADARGVGVVAVSSGWMPEVLRCVDGVSWRAAAVRPPGQPALVASCGEVLALACVRGAGAVSVDGGTNWVSWPLLEGASALALVDTDDGAVHAIVAVYDEAHDRALVFAAAVGARGEARGARRLGDIDALLAVQAESSGDEAEARVEVLAPLDPAGRRVLAITPRGVVVLARD